MNLDLDYFTLDDIDSRNFKIYIMNENDKSLIRNFLVGKNSVVENLPTQDGLRFFDAKYDQRRIKLKVFVDGNIDNSTLRYFAAWINQKIPRKLILSQEPYRYYNAIIENEVDLEQFGNNGIFDLEFICYNPFAYMTIPTVDDGDGKIEYDEGYYYHSGIIYDTPPYIIQNINTNTSFDIYHGGNTDEALPNIKIKGSCTNITIINNSTGESCSYGSLSNDTLEINSEYTNCYLNGVMDNSSFEGDYIKLNGIGKNYDFNENGEFVPILADGMNNITISGTNLILSEVSFIFRYTYI